MRVTVLGSGSSSGVPAIGMGWGACDPNEQKNKRRRSGLLLEAKGLTILFDTSPDCRSQLLDAQINHLDAVIYTHAHADHCHGIDELRWICNAMGSSLPIYGMEESLKELQKRFAYCFTPLEGTAHNYFYKPVLDPKPLIKPYKTFNVSGLEIIPFEQDHGFSKSLGFRIGKLAYTTDVLNLDNESFKILDGIDTWILGCLQPTPHQTHIHTEKALEWIDRVQPKNAYLTHMNNKMDYQTLCNELPDQVKPAYDGLVLEVI